MAPVIYLSFGLALVANNLHAIHQASHPEMPCEARINWCQAPVDPFALPDSAEQHRNSRPATSIRPIAGEERTVSETAPTLSFGVLPRG